MVEIGPKDWFFWLILRFFCITLLHSVSYAPRFFQMKDLIQIYICDKFLQNSICCCEVKNVLSFSYWFSIHEVAPFFRRRGEGLEGWGWFEPFLPQILFNSAEILNRGSPPVRETQCLKNASKFWILVLMECTQSLQFCSILGPNLPLENQRNCLKPKFMQKLHP